VRKITVLLLAIVFLVSFALSGCGAAKTEAPAAQDGAAAQSDGQAAVEKEVSTTKPAEPVELSFWTFQELHKGFWDDAVAAWNTAHPDRPVTLKTDVYPYDEQHNKLLIALQSGTGAPDIADIELGKFANFLKGTPALVPLNSIVDPVKDQLIMGRMDNYAKDGKYYGADYHVGAEVMYYNKEILDKAGVNADNIKTWDDYLAAGKTVLAATGKPMATVEVTEHWSYYPLINMQNSDIFDAKGNVILDNDTNIKTLQMLKDGLYRDKIFVAAPGGFHHSEEYWAWMNKGNAASIWMPLWYMGRFTQYMPDLKGKMIIRPMPVFPDGKKSAGEGGTGTVITNQCKVQDLALQLMAEAKLSKEGSIKTWTILGFDPIRADAWSDPAMSASNQYTDYFGSDVFSTLQSIVGDIGGLNLTEKYPAAITLLQKNVMFKALKEQSQTPEEALKAAAEELRK
jgi:arabinosaccharide transport system substrate-binding protein